MTITYKVKYNKRNKRYVVFRVDSEVKGFGSWKIKKSYKTRSEADAYARQMNR